GSAVSVLLACIFVYFTRSYVYIFFFSIIPYAINLINFAGYPKELDGEMAQDIKLKQVLVHIKESFLGVMTKPSLRRLIVESMGFEGFFKSIKDYLQPILEQAAIPVIALFFSGLVMTQEQKSVILIGPVYFSLFVLSAVASRKSHLLVSHLGTEDSAARRLWFFMFLLMVLLVPSLYFGLYWISITGFLLLYILQNLWRPVLISRFDTHSSEAQGATLLSMESQAKSLSTMIMAPILGRVVDFVLTRKIGVLEFWPVAVVGMILAGIFFISSKRRNA
nr:hypothetical protein [Spirochaetaceae bacterium]